MIIDHNDLMYRKQWEYAREHRFNGAYYYSTEIVKNIIPNVKTDRNWITVNTKGVPIGHSIVFVHDNLFPERTYSWLANTRDLIMVCGVKETMPKVRRYGIPVYLPLSVDVDYVKQFKTEKTKDTAYVGRKDKPGTEKLPKNIDYLSGMTREMLLRRWLNTARFTLLADALLRPRYLAARYCRLTNVILTHPCGKFWIIKMLLKYYKKSLIK